VPSEEVLSREGLLARLAERIGSVRVDHPVRVAVDGPDAAGKTALADQLAGLMRAAGTAVIRASADGFHRPRAERYARGPDSPEGYYRDSFNHEQMLASLLDPLGPGGSRVYRVACFDFGADKPSHPDPVLAKEDAVLLLDGVFLLRPELREAWDFSVFVTASFEVTLQRARQRDASQFGSGAAVERRYRTRYIPGQELYFAEAQPELIADVVVINDHPSAPLLRSP
jgi:uridine kinase